MKKSLIFAVLAIFVVGSAVNTYSQEQNKAMMDEFAKIVKLSQTKKPEDQTKAYEQSRTFLKKYGKETNDSVKKVRDYHDKFRLQLFTKALDATKIPEAHTIGKEILSENPEDTFVTLNLAYGMYDALIKNKDTSNATDAIAYAKKTLDLLAAGKMPLSFEPLKDQNDATAVMYFVIGNFLVDTNLDEAAQSFFKAVGYESQVKNTAYPFSVIAFLYEKKYEVAAKDFTAKHGSKTREDDAMKADAEKLDKVVDRMLDAYARAIKVAEVDKNSNKDTWMQRFTQVYQYRKKSDAGLTDYIANILSTPLADPSTL